MTETLPGKPRRGLLLCLKLAVLGILLWAIRRFLVGAIEELRSQPLTLETGWLFAAGGAYLVGMAPAAWFWRRVLARLGLQAGLYPAFRAYYIGHLGKYVPGKAMVVAMRVALLPTPRAWIGVAVISVFYETLAMIAVGGAVGGLIVAALHTDRAALGLAGLAVALCAGLPLVPAVAVDCARMVRLDRRMPELVAAVARLRIVHVAPGWLALTGGWFVLGLSLLATVLALGGRVEDFPREALTCTAVAALSIAGGFFSLLPGGVGVREALIIPLLAPRYGEGTALAAALLWRVVSVVAELVLSAILYPMRGRPRA